MPAEPISVTNEELKHKDTPITWLDNFLGMLFQPVETLNIMSNPGLLPPNSAELLGSMLIVIICALTNSCVYNSALLWALRVNTRMSLLLWLANAMFSIMMILFFWLALAVFIRLSAALIKSKVSLRACFLVTGWAFTPLIFKAPAACFSNVTELGEILSIVISVWFFVLVLFAFDSLLKFGRLKALAFMLLLPPCLFLCYCVCLIFASTFI